MGSRINFGNISFFKFNIMLENLIYDNKSKRIVYLDNSVYTENNGETVVPRVSNILGIIDKGYEYHEWLKQTGYNSNYIIARAMRIGSIVHGMIETFLKTGTLENTFKETIRDEDESELRYPKETWVMFDKFIQFLLALKAKYGFKILGIETVIASDKLGFGGQLDLVVEFNDQVWLIDHKTGNALYDNYALQLASYKQLFNSKIKKTQIDRTAILWLNSQHRGEDKSGKKIQGRGWILKEYSIEEDQINWNKFKNVYNVWKDNNPNFKANTFSLPVSYNLSDIIS